MKKNSILIALAAFVLLVSCQEKVPTDREQLDSRTASSLVVSFEKDGQAVQALSFGHEFSRPVLKVNVNNDGLRWNLKSDRPWCKVIEETHRGSGNVTLELSSNDSVDPRETATLTFTAGGFTFDQFAITVDQRASVFVISKPYLVAGKDGGVFAVDVKTKESVNWTFEPEDSWLSATSGNPVTADGETVRTLTITAQASAESSRLGTLTLNDGTDSDVIRLWQFGTDYQWQDGKIFFDREEEASFSLLLPCNLLKEVNKPDYALCTSKSVDDYMDQLEFSISDYLSDVSSMRDVAISLVLNNDSEVALPLVLQNYSPAGGLMSAGGLKAFAAAVAAGGDTSDWQDEEGWVTMLQDIDMTGVTDWAGIGTAEKPFAGKFDGKSHSIFNLQSSRNAIFNNCCGESEINTAIVKDLIVASDCSFYANLADWEGNACFAAIVSQAVNAQITGCVNGGNIEFGGNSADDSPAYVGGVLGKGGEGVSVRSCSVSEGTISVAGTSSEAHIGGIAGSVSSVRSCTMSGILRGEGTFENLYLGGITGLLAKDDSVNGNSFKGTLILAGSSLNNYVGGLYGATGSESEFNFDNATDMSVLGGTIQVNGFRNDTGSNAFVGGFIGYAAPSSKLSFKGYTTQTAIIFDNSTDRAVSYCCAGGVLGGCDPKTKLASLSFENITSEKGGVSIIFGAGNGDKTRRDHHYYGGVVGFVNGPAGFTNCSNASNVGVKGGSANNESSSSNYKSVCIGGIAGYAIGGDVTFSLCSNSGNIHGRFYVNNVLLSQTLAGTAGVQSAGGIVGAFNLYPSDDGKLTMTDCENSGWINVYRGWAGGVAGFCRNVTLTRCNSLVTKSSNHMDGAGNIQGGIAGCAIASEFDNCKAKVNVNAGIGGNANNYGSNAGGIVGRFEGSEASKVNSCSYYGKITPAAPSGDKPQNGGGIVGYAPNTVTVSNCRYGGEVKGTSVTQSSAQDKLIELAIGNGGATPSGISFWDGN